MNHLLQDLESRINPEKNRRFAPEEFGRRLILLADFVASRWPQKNGWRFSVVGTNGKGSLSHYLGSILHRAGFDVGLYTSPHLSHFSERIRINGEPLNESSLEFHYQALKDRFLLPFPESDVSASGSGAKTRVSATKQLWKDLSYFELLTLLALESFQTLGPAAQIYEAGLGGRLDATRLNDPEVVVVTKIALDHTSLLGNTKQAIFREKLGICGPSTRQLFLMEERYESDARHFFAARASETAGAFSRSSAAPEVMAAMPMIHCFPEQPEPGEEHYLEHNYRFAAWILETLEKESAKGLQEKLYRQSGRRTSDAEGEAVTAAADGPPKRISIPATRSAFSDPPGRMFETNRHGLRWIYDSGHNPASLHAVLKNAGQQASAPLLVLGILPDRSYRQFLRMARLHGISRPLCIQREGLASIPESVPREDILNALDSPSENLRRILKTCKDAQRTTVLFTGSYRIYDLFLEILGGDIVHA
ncbi:MAG: hypothetical protein KDK23_05030 [Leptospiraceae bacterium]|nr:hypothetical protein [Leptospiraceae bacterium]